MGSSQFGELGLGNGRSGSSNKKGKKRNPEKPKQPQRGLGVAQLEKIILQNQMAGYLPPLQSPFYSNLNKDDDVRIEMTFSSSPSSSPNSASSSSLLHLHPNIMMGLGGYEITAIRCGEFQSSPTTRLLMNQGDIFQPHHFAEQTMTLPLLEQSMEDFVQKKRRHDWCNLTGSISQNSDSSDAAQELDLDLKL